MKSACIGLILLIAVGCESIPTPAPQPVAGMEQAWLVRDLNPAGAELPQFYRLFQGARPTLDPEWAAWDDVGYLLYLRTTPPAGLPELEPGGLLECEVLVRPTMRRPRSRR